MTNIILIKLKDLRLFVKNNNIPLICKFEHVKKLLTRYSWNTTANKFLLTEECKEIWSNYGKIARTSKMILIESSKNTGKDYIIELMTCAGMEYPIIVKSDKTFNSKFTHKKYIIQSNEGFVDLYNDIDFIHEDLIAEELIPHSEDLLIKVHFFSERTWFWRVDKSIPTQSYFTNGYFADNSLILSANKDLKSSWNRVQSDIDNESRIDAKFIIDICTRVLREFQVKFAGFDIVVSNTDGS